MSKLNDWLGLITNVGVIIGLVLVAYEINQTHEAMDRDRQAQANDVYFGSRSGWQAFNTGIAHDHQTADIWLRGRQGEPLDAVESERFRYLALEWLNLNRYTYDNWSSFNNNQPADWQIDNFFMPELRRNPGLKAFVVRQLSVPDPSRHLVRAIERHPEDFK